MTARKVCRFTKMPHPLNFPDCDPDAGPCAADPASKALDVGDQLAEIAVELEAHRKILTAVDRIQAANRVTDLFGADVLRGIDEAFRSRRPAPLARIAEAISAAGERRPAVLEQIDKAFQRRTRS